MAPRNNSPRGCTLTRADLAAAVVARLAMSRRQSADLVDMLLTEVADALGRGEDVKLASFGAFIVRDKRARIGRNPKPGADATIAARRVLLFHASRTLRDRVGVLVQEPPAGTSHGARGEDTPALR